MTTSLLALAREARSKLDNEKRLADLVPKLEAQEKEANQANAVRLAKSTARAELDELLVEYHKAKELRDKSIDELCQLFSSVIQTCRSFDSISNIASEKYKTIGDMSLRQGDFGGYESDSGSFNQELLVGAIVDLQRADDIYPLSAFKGDQSTASLDLLRVLARYVRLAIE